MRLGAPIFDECPDPDAWVRAVKRKGYRAAYCPLGSSADEMTIQAYARAAQASDIVIAEVGAWSNPLHPDEKKRQEAISYCKAQLYLADRIGARCCVNIAGSRGQKWDGPDPADLTDETFDMIVETVRDVIDSVSPTQTYYTLETMPWMYPDSAESYHRLIMAIDRKRFAVHFDPVNLICSPQRYYSSGSLIKEFVQKLGPLIRSCHGKDVFMSEKFIVHLDEVRPGLGNLDYRAYLRALSELDPDVPLMLEHLSSEEEYDRAVSYIRAIEAETMPS